MLLAAEVLTALHETGTLQRSPAVAHALELLLQELADVLASFSVRWLIGWVLLPSPGIRVFESWSCVQGLAYTFTRWRE